MGTIAIRPIVEDDFVGNHFTGYSCCIEVQWRYEIGLPYSKACNEDAVFIRKCLTISTYDFFACAVVDNEVHPRASSSCHIDDLASD